MAIDATAARLKGLESVHVRERANERLKVLEADYLASANIPWIRLNTLFVNSWADYSVPYGPAYYRKVGDEVQLRGLILGGTIGTVIATLPAGYRPQYEPIFTCAAATGVTEVRVATTGSIQAATNYAGGNAASWLSLSQVRFSTL